MYTSFRSYIEKKGERLKLQNEVFICLDCEATGLEVTTEEIVEIAVVKFTFQEILERFETLIDP